MNDMHAMVAKPALRQSGVYLASVADQEKGSDPLFGLQSPLDALNDHPAAVVATHDIHCNSHIGTQAERTLALRRETVRLRRSRL